jgi:hypothetical protein
VLPADEKSDVVLQQKIRVAQVENTTAADFQTSRNDVESVLKTTASVTENILEDVKIKTSKENIGKNDFDSSKIADFINKRIEEAKIPDKYRKDLSYLKEPEITTLPVHTRYPHATNVNYSFYRIHDRININKKAKPKYYFSIISMFKNERGIMKEWLDHHIGHGVDHFYLIDDGSTDGIMDVLDTYVKNGERDKICICNFI